jgi:hypothetical protein
LVPLGHLRRDIFVSRHAKIESADNIRLMQWSIFVIEIILDRKEKVGIVTRVVRVNWFVGRVNCTNDKDCNLILYSLMSLLD